MLKNVKCRLGKLSHRVFSQNFLKIMDIRLCLCFLSSVSLTMFLKLPTIHLVDSLILDHLLAHSQGLVALPGIHSTQVSINSISRVYADPGK